MNEQELKEMGQSIIDFNKNEGLKVGTQILHMPPHVKYNRYHPDVEYGFVASVQDGALHCHFWRKDRVGGELRTKANAELVPLDSILAWHLVRQEFVDRAMKEIEEKSYKK